MHKHELVSKNLIFLIQGTAKRLIKAETRFQKFNRKIIFSICRQEKEKIFQKGYDQPGNIYY